MRRAMFVSAAALLASVSLAKGLFGPPAGFEIYSVDDSGGGWVVHRMKGRGDTLWGCQDVKSVDTCTQVYMNDWKTMTSLNFIHITDSSQKAWLRLTAPGMGDTLLACSDPEGTPMCTPVELELRPGLSTYKRVWPAYDCKAECELSQAALKDTDPRYFIEPAAKGDMWLQVGPKIPGPANLYACTGLESEPVCKLTVPNWLAFDRENLGFKKLVDIETEGPDGEVVYGPGVMVDKIDEESVAYEAGFREGDVILKVGEFETNRAKHARYLMLQYPAEDTITLTKGDGSTVDVTPRRKPKKK